MMATQTSLFEFFGESGPSCSVDDNQDIREPESEYEIDVEDSEYEIDVEDAQILVKGPGDHSASPD